MKYSESQKEIIAFVPQEVLDNKTLTDAAKLVYGALVMYRGTEKYKNDGYFFRTNEEIAKECEISIKSVQRAISLLTNMNLIKKTTGKRHMANEYVIEENVHLETKNVHLDVKMSTSKNVHLEEDKNVKMSTLFEKMSILETRMNTIFERQNEILELLKMSFSNEKMSTSKNVLLKNKNVPTDTETDTDEDTDKNTIEISYCSDSTENNIVEIKEKINKKEIESVVSDNGTNETQHNTPTTEEDMNTKSNRDKINNLKNEIKRQQEIMYHTQLQEAGEQAYNLMCVHMNNLKNLMSNEEYNKYRTHIKNWWEKTKKYLKWQTKKDQAEQIAKDKIESALQGYQYATDVETAKNMLQLLTNRIENYHGEDVDEIYTTYIAKVNDIRKSSPIHEQAFNIFANGEDECQEEINVTEATETPQIQSQTAQVEQLPTEGNINELCAHTEDEIITDDEKPNDADEEIEDTPNLEVNLDNRIVNEDEFEAFWSTLDDDNRYIGSPKVA